MRKKVKFRELKNGETFIAREIYFDCKRATYEGVARFSGDDEVEVEIEEPTITFGDLAIGEKFVYNKKQFKKIVPFVAFTEYSEANAVRSDDVCFYICLGAIVERLP